MSELLRFWPSRENLAQVLTTEAEAASTSVALAVHQPVEFIRKTLGESETELRVSETELLEWFIDDSAHNDGFRILPLVGESGVGKSHVVRWLDARLDALPDADQRVVVRVPKGQSLRGVLDQILSRKEFQGDIYDGYREKIRGARDGINPKEAAGLLCERLAQSLEEFAERAQDQRLGAAPGDTADKELAKLFRAYGISPMLPTLLRNQQLRDLHFVKTEKDPGVVRRLVAQLYEDNTGALIEDREHIFEESDLELPESFYESADEYGGAVLKAADRCFRDEKRRSQAIDVLNAALDPAKRELVGIGEAVQSLFLDVRAALNRDGKELVLLVEDFAVLSGLQGQLLQVIQQGRHRAGGDELCTIRTVLAYTPGYLLTRTILGRALYEYIIPEFDDTEDVTHTRVCSLVAAYLNAARVGTLQLDDALSRSPENTDSEDWAPIFEMNDHERDILLPFGFHSNIPLFPFNRAAIRAFTEEACTRGGRLTYNPRIVIQLVLRRILHERRDFENGEFPPDHFDGDYQIRGEVNALVTNISNLAPSAEKDRYLLVVKYWANESDPASLKMVTSGIASAFGLTPLDEGSVDVKALAGQLETNIASSATAVVNADVARASSRRISGPVAAPSVERWRSRMEEWLSRNVDSPLAQKDATDLRKCVVAALNAAVDWDWVCIKPDVEFSERNVYLSGSPTGANKEEAVVIAASDEDRASIDAGNRRRGELIAVAAHHDDKNDFIGVDGWIHDSAEDDLARYCAFVERHASEWRDHRVTHPFGIDWSPVEMCVTGLVVSARIRYGDTLALNDRSKALNTMFKPGSIETRTTESTDLWGRVHDQLYRLADPENPGSFRSVLLRMVGARQGGGRSVLGIDASRIYSVFEKALEDFALQLNAPSGLPKKLELWSFLREVPDLKKLDSAIDKHVEETRAWLMFMAEGLGEEWDKDTLCEDLRELLSEAPADFLDSARKRKMRKAIDKFKKSAVKEALATARTLTDANVGRAHKLAALSTDTSSAQEAATSMLRILDEELAAARKNVEAQLTGLGNPMTEAKKALDHAVQEIVAVTAESAGGSGVRVRNDGP